MYVCMYVCMWRVCVCVCVCVCACMCVCVCVCVCIICMYLCLCTQKLPGFESVKDADWKGNTGASIYLHVYMHVRIQCTYTCVHVRIHVYMHVRIHVYMHVRIPSLWSRHPHLLSHPQPLILSPSMSFRSRGPCKKASVSHGGNFEAKFLRPFPPLKKRPRFRTFCVSSNKTHRIL